MGGGTKGAKGENGRSKEPTSPGPTSPPPTTISRMLSLVAEVPPNLEPTEEDRAKLERRSSSKKKSSRVRIYLKF